MFYRGKKIVSLTMQIALKQLSEETCKHSSKRDNWVKLIFLCIKIKSKYMFKNMLKPTNINIGYILFVIQ
jgi:hypothetical protein